MEHGHSKSERRNMAVHRLAFRKLRSDPIRGREKVIRLLEEWLRAPGLRRQALFLEEWRRALDLPIDDLESRILGEGGQSLRQSSPMGVLITPAERFEVYREIWRLNAGRHEPRATGARDPRRRRDRGGRRDLRLREPVHPSGSGASWSRRSRRP